MLTKITLIRHGQTRWNNKKRYLGHSDIDLDMMGKKQAQATKRRIKNEAFHKIYSSDLKRAYHFAEILFKEKNVHKLPQLRELNFGIFEGKTHQEIMSSSALIYTQWLNNPFKTDIPDGESLKSFKTRIIKAFLKIITDNKGKAVCIVTHAGPIRIILNHIAKKNNIWEPLPRLASIHMIEYTGREAKITTLNDTSHLTLF